MSSSDVRSDVLPENPSVNGAASVAGAVAEMASGDELTTAFSDPPLWEKRVLEFAPHWDGLSADLEWAAERLRVFLITWDPFEWRPDRPVAFATSTSRADGVGLVLYLPHWQAAAMARAVAGGSPSGDSSAALAAVIGRLAESVLVVAGEQRVAIVDGDYAAGVHSGALPRLLSRIPGSPALARPTLAVVGDGWQPIQFDVLEDLGQDIFGPADLDRSPVRFREPGEKRPGCPGCAGRAVAFPDGLKDTQDVICGAHRAEALRITTARLEAAKASNPSGWEALLDAGQRLLEPHLPNGLGPRLVAAAGTGEASVADLAGQAATVIEAAALMEGLPDPQTTVGGRLAPVVPWLRQLPSVLVTAGLDEEATRVAAAAGELLHTPGEEALVAAAAEEAQPAKPVPFRRESRVGRNALCPCGSGRKYKFCHGR